MPAKKEEDQQGTVMVRIKDAEYLLTMTEAVSLASTLLCTIEMVMKNE